MDVWLLDPEDVEGVMTELEWARDCGATVRVAWDGGLKVKTGYGTWTQPLGRPDPAARP